MRVRTNDPVFTATGNVLSGATSTAQPITTESALATALASAKSYWATTLGIPLASLSDIRIAIADLPSTTMALTIGRTIYVDRDGAGGGWTSTTLYNAVKQELGHILGQS